VISAKAAGVRALFNPGDFDADDYWSKFVSGHLVETRGTQQDIYGLGKSDMASPCARCTRPTSSCWISRPAKCSCSRKGCTRFITLRALSGRTRN
jgi:hypothetical protein